MARTQTLRVINGGKVSQGNELDALTQKAKPIVADCRILVKYESDDQRRYRYVEYGRVLLDIKKQFKSTNAFYDHLKKHDLEVKDKDFRNDAMWYAENWRAIDTSNRKCPYTNPHDIRQWWGVLEGTRKPRTPSKPEPRSPEPRSPEPRWEPPGAREPAPKEPEHLDLDEMVQELYQALSDTNSAASRLAIEVDNGKDFDSADIDYMWSKLETTMKRLKR